jgi:polyhydroxybutyrate depolymerase
MRALLAVLLAAVLLAGCAAEPQPEPIPAGSSGHTLRIDGVDRAYRVYVPSDLPDEQVPLVVMLHGGFGSAVQAENVYGWDAAADAGGFVVAYPDGLGRAWNAGGCCGQAAARNVDDVGFVSAVVQELARRLELDPDRVFVTGMSNGGIMAYRMACETELFAAVGVVSATMLVDCAAKRPVSVLHIQGARDESIPPDGSPGGGTQKIDGPPLAEVLAYWRGVDRCGAPVTTPRADPLVTETAARDCEDGTAVVYVEIADAGHQWPGAPSSELREELGGDPPSTRLDATAELAEFFGL